MKGFDVDDSDDEDVFTSILPVKPSQTSNAPQPAEAEEPSQEPRIAKQAKLFPEDDEEDEDDFFKPQH